METLKAPTVPFAATLTDAGIVNAGDTLLVNATAVAAVTAFDRVTQHNPVALEPILATVQLSVMVDEACSDILAVAVVPLSAPVKVAV